MSANSPHRMVLPLAVCGLFLCVCKIIPLQNYSTCRRPYLELVDFLYWWGALVVCINFNTMSYLGLKNRSEYILTIFVALCGGMLFWVILFLGKVILRNLQRRFG